MSKIVIFYSVSQSSSESDHVARLIEDATVFAVLAFLGRLYVTPQSRGVCADARPSAGTRSRLAAQLRRHQVAVWTESSGVAVHLAH